ncbi:prepilin-type N-terminal cleavage/methylation domain-containing protein [Curtobacterium herbarum]|uniref:Prepilin-type N-terminal cleavage/methylation domain-containing protein n=1 Tax=Curtobacterium herbarum TaxID=150122 RepID=A0ABN1ZBA4_9MICO|nr:prepilin-type N-terminal cleavage/methylation domain-containing protein [Curtobacterium herbarum]MBM7474025.1 type II secretory pathway pseudopilin PulG [Curtobacterium herbarum]MCS6544649.1 prepilin-type N-terminal cleavage/methylation domain-containing protein [Curtobacterium herbarum]
MLRITTLLDRARERDEGLSIVEVLVAMTVFAMIAAGVAMGIASSLYLAHSSRSREVAINLAQDAVDSARTSTNLFSVVDGTTTPTVGGLRYTVKQVARWVPSSGSANACGAAGANGGPLAYKRISLTVSWSSASTQSVSMNSLVAPTSSVTAANLGTIIVSASLVSGSGNAGAAVSITPAVTSPGGAGAITATIPKTDANGCSYALNVKPGRYDVRLSEPGNIDDGTSSGSLGAQTATPSTTVTVQANQTSAANFNYDQALTVVPQWSDPNASARPFATPTSTAVSLRRKSADYGPYPTGVATQVFPYTDGYKAVAGTPASCLSVDPENWTTTSGTAVAPRNAPQPEAGTNAVKAPVQTFAVKLNGKQDNSLRAVSVAPDAGSGDPGCATTTTYTFTNLPTNGNAIIALPYGTWSLQSGTVVSVLSGLVTITFSSTPPTVTTAPGVTATASKVLLDPRRAP